MPKGIFKRSPEAIIKLAINAKKARKRLKELGSPRGSRIYATNNDHPYWRGEKAGYCAKHGWIKKYYGIANMCIKADETCKGRFEWSNKDHKYSRDIKDWQQLCVSHHKRYDIKKFKFVAWNKGMKIKDGLWLKKEGLL